jgi:branched-chain amino acid transport system substrate-binding protein
LIYLKEKSVKNFMRRKMKKISTLLVVMMIFTLVLAACAPAAAPTKAPAAVEPTKAPAAVEPTKAPAAVEPTKAPAKVEPKGDILIGNLQDESGGMKALSSALTFAATLKVEEINAAGGINGRMLKLITYDTRSDVNEAINAYTRMVQQDKVSIVLGPPIANIGIAIAPVSQELKVPVVGLFMDDKCTMQENGEPWTYMFLAQNSATTQGTIMATYAVKELGVKKVAVLYNSQNSYSVGLANPFIKVVEASGGEIVAKETYTSTDKDFRAQLTKIKAAQPDALYFPSYPVEIPLIYTQAYELGLNVPMFGSNSVPPTGLAPSTDPAATTNTFYPYGINPSEPVLVDWAANYKAKFETNAIAQSFSGADAFGIIVKAIEACGDNVSSECLTAELNKGTEYVGFQGNVKLSPTTHQPEALPMAIMTIKEGKAEFVTYYSPAGPVVK